jgi:hypothetical protein
MNLKQSIRIGGALFAIAAALGVGAASPMSALGAGPELAVETSHVPSISSNPSASRPGIPIGGRAKYVLKVSNSGDSATTAPVTVSFSLPANMRATHALNEKSGAWACAIEAAAHQVSCTGPSGAGVQPGQQACLTALGGGSPCRIVIIVALEPAAQVGDALTPTVQACGGGAADCASAADPIEVVPHFEITHFDGGAFEGNADPSTPTKNYDPIISQSGEPETQAGAHPESASTSFTLTQTASADGYIYATGDQNQVVAELPAGFLANVGAVPTCADADLSPGTGTPECPVGSQIGFVGIFAGGNVGGSDSDKGLAQAANWGRVYVPLYSMDAADGYAALFGFSSAGAVFHIVGRLKSDPGIAGGYRAVLELVASPQTLTLVGSSVTVWGVPASSSHDSQRGLDCSLLSGSGAGCLPSPAPKKPFLTLPTSCEGPVETKLNLNTWQGDVASASFLSHDNTMPTPQPIGIEGCNNLAFSPTLEARPTTNVADSPSGLDVDLHVPQNEDPNGNATAHLRDTVVTLPEGMSVNPSAANGLDACAPSEIKLGTDEPDSCPDAAKLGTVRVDTPLLDHPVEGAVYIASPYDNPFDSLLALYISLDDPISGTVVKIAGKVKADPVSGQLTATFQENPQAPFEDFRVHFFGGAGGSLRTPATCGTYSTTSSLTPWSAPDSGPPATPSDTWAIERGPGGSCANSVSQLPNSPSFDVGTISPIAGAKTPLVVNLRRDDATQQFSSLTLTPPQGLVGKLAGIPYCLDSALAEAAAKSGRTEEASSSCPAASYVGSVVAAAGAGPTPYYAPGKAYLTGPYKGAPLSLAIVTPATAGPFDLGTIVVRTALYVDSRTAQITAVSDPIPSILQGIPLDVRSVQVKLDRPDFTLNPTSCDPMSFGGSLLSTLGNSAALQSRFQVGECERLGLKPRLSLRLKGPTKRSGYPALTAILEPRAGDANLANISVALPHSEFLAQEHIRTVCTRVQFAADACPAASIYGTATVTTPLLDYPLTGPVYLRSSDNPLPDLVPDLRGPVSQPIKLESAGRTDSIKGGIRNTFDFVPDAPFTKLVLQMQGGKKGLLVNSRNICKQANKATVKYGSHNGKAYEARPVLKAQCPKAAKHRRSKHRAARHGAR